MIRISTIVSVQPISGLHNSLAVCHVSIPIAHFQSPAPLTDTQARTRLHEHKEAYEEADEHEGEEKGRKDGIWHTTAFATNP